MIREDEVYRIGTLKKPHGVRGEVNFTFTSDVWDRVAAPYLVVRLDGILVPFFLEAYRFRTDEVALVKFEGIDTVEEVSELCGADVYFPRSLTPDDEEEELTLDYFKGFRIVDEQAGEVGTITDVDDTTANPLFIVGDVLIPAQDAFIQSIDHEGRILHMQLPEGLIDPTDN